MGSTTFGQSTDFDVKFIDDRLSLSKYLQIQYRGAIVQVLADSPPHAHSATVNLTIDKTGKILKAELIEKSKNEVFNEFVIKLANSTNNKWKLTNPSNNLSSFNVIIPFLLKTPESDTDTAHLELAKEFQEYHKSLKPSVIKTVRVIAV